MPVESGPHQRFWLRDDDGVEWQATLRGRVLQDLVFFLEEADVFLWLNEEELEDMFDAGTATHLHEDVSTATQDGAIARHAAALADVHCPASERSDTALRHDRAPMALRDRLPLPTSADQASTGRDAR